eukprot:jgi/Galph1/2583/GphlegSOOS_G1247.1
MFRSVCTLLRDKSLSGYWIPSRSTKTLLEKQITREKLDDFTIDELYEYIKERTYWPGQKPLHYEKLRTYCYRARTDVDFDRAYELIFDYHKKLLPVHGKESCESHRTLEIFGFQPGIVGHGVLLTALAKMGDVESMNKLWNCALQGCVLLNTHLLTEFLRRFAKVKAYDKANEVLKTAKERNVRLRAAGFHVLAAAKLQDKQPEQAMQILSLMPEYNCQRNEATESLIKEIEAALSLDKKH